MTGHLNPYTIPVALAALVSWAVALAIWRRRPVAAAHASALLMIAAGVWSTGHALGLASATLEGRMFWARFQYFGIVATPLAWFAFAHYFNGRGLLRWRTWALLLMEPVLVLALVWTNDWHGLIWRRIDPTTVAGYPILGVTHGAAFWVHTVYSYGLLLAGLALFMPSLLRPGNPYRTPVAVVVVCAIAAVASNLVQLAGLAAPVNLTVFGFTIAGLGTAFALWSMGLVDLLPVARDLILERLDEGVVVLDWLDRVVDANPAGARILGFDRRAAIGRDVGQVISPDVHRHLSTMRPGGEEIQLGAGDEARVYELRVTPLGNEGAPASGRLVALRDVTEHKRTEEQLARARDAAEAADRAKSEFLATMSHEIRTPMNAVIGMSGLLLDYTSLDAEQRGFVQTIRTGGEALLAIINDILDLSRIDAGRIELEEVAFDPCECVEESVDLLASEAAQKGLEIYTWVDPAVAEQVYGDVTRLRQVLVNLLSNAVKFTRAGEIAVSVEPVTEGLRFAVRDTGIGIPADKMDRLFHPFTQVDASTTREYGGTGLGLAISRRLCERMAGSIGVESTAGVGSTFHFTLPLRAAPRRGEATEPAAPELGRKRLLVVEDSAGLRATLAKQARAWSLHVRAVATVDEARAILRDGETFDAALVDDAAALSAREFAALSVVLVGDMRRQGEDGGAAGAASRPAAGVLAKPIKRAHLRAVLAAAFGRQQAVEPVEAPPDAAEVHHLRILVVEDNAVNRQMAVKMLARMGYRADSVEDGREALEAVRRQRYDVLLMDVQMPEMDGLEATRRIRKELPRERQPWIVAVTAFALAGDRDRCLAAGMDDYLSKPFGMQDVRAALERADKKTGCHTVSC